MAINKWKGDAPKVAQVARAAIDTGTTWANTDTVTFTINSKAVVHTLTTEANTHADILTNAAITLNASTIPEFEEITWANYANTHVQATVDTAGKPVTMSAVVVDTAGDGAWGNFSDATTSSGPNDGSVALNWSLGAVPVNTNEIIYENSNVDCKYNIDFSTVQPASVTIRQSYTGDIGLPQTNVDTDHTDSYVEYRTGSLTFGNAAGASTVDIGEGEGTGSGRLKIDMGAGDTTFTVHNSGQRAETGIPSVLMKGTNASDSLTTIKGDVGFAFFGGETGNLSGGVNIGFRDNLLGDSKVVFGDGMTLAAITQSGGKLTIKDNATTVIQYGGELTVEEAATITTLTCHGTVYDFSSGTFATVNIGPRGTFDHSRSQITKEISALNMWSGATYLDPNDVISEDNDIVLNQARLSEVTIDKPPGKIITVT